MPEEFVLYSLRGLTSLFSALFRECYKALLVCLQDLQHCSDWYLE